MSTFSPWFQNNKLWIFVWISVVILISLSFGAGYLFAKQDNPAPILIEKCSKN